jgi:hypothetical protein
LVGYAYTMWFEPTSFHRIITPAAPVKWRQVFDGKQIEEKPQNGLPVLRQKVLLCSFP